MKPRERRHRLDPLAYAGQGNVFFTACVKHRARPFANKDRTKVYVEHLEQALSHFRCRAVIYCFMPDHLHAVLNGYEGSSDMKGAFDRFKQTSGFHLRKDGFEWQKDYYDHVIRKGEDIHEVVAYVGANPVRAGLVESPLDYHGLGAVGFDITEVLSH
ncbi:MAG TPA: transposase [Fimbriimonadaceae bacterium]|nr:transposase [Fimbriimonadaceae bacterium]